MNNKEILYFHCITSQVVQLILFYICANVNFLTFMSQPHFFPKIKPHHVICERRNEATTVALTDFKSQLCLDTPSRQISPLCRRSCGLNAPIYQLDRTSEGCCTEIVFP